jgi:hypothetical protein
MQNVQQTDENVCGSLKGNTMDAKFVPVVSEKSTGPIDELR